MSAKKIQNYCTKSFIINTGNVNLGFEWAGNKTARPNDLN